MSLLSDGDAEKSKQSSFRIGHSSFDKWSVQLSICHNWFWKPLRKLPDPNSKLQWTRKSEIITLLEVFLIFSTFLGTIFYLRILQGENSSMMIFVGSMFLPLLLTATAKLFQFVHEWFTLVQGLRSFMQNSESNIQPLTLFGSQSIIFGIWRFAILLWRPAIDLMQALLWKIHQWNGSLMPLLFNKITSYFGIVMVFAYSIFLGTNF